jgi:hypothetical protein
MTDFNLKDVVEVLKATTEVLSGFSKLFKEMDTLTDSVRPKIVELESEVVEEESDNKTSTKNCKN